MYDMDRMRTREILGSGRNCIENFVNAEYTWSVAAAFIHL